MVTLANIQSISLSPAPSMQCLRLRWKLKRYLDHRGGLGATVVMAIFPFECLQQQSEVGPSLQTHLFIRYFLEFAVIQNEVTAVLWRKVSLLRHQHTSKAAMTGLGMSLVAYDSRL